MTREFYSQAYSNGFDRTVRFLRSRGIHNENAREVAQAAWARGWERIGQLRDDRIVLTWVNAIALNLYRGAIRKSRELSLTPDYPDRRDFDWARLDVDRILRNSHPRDRELLRSYLDGLTTEEIAAALGVSQTAIRLRFFRARRQACRQFKER